LIDLAFRSFFPESTG